MRWYEWQCLCWRSRTLSLYAVIRVTVFCWRSRTLSLYAVIRVTVFVLKKPYTFPLRGDMSDSVLLKKPYTFSLRGDTSDSVFVEEAVHFLFTRWYEWQCFCWRSRTLSLYAVIRVTVLVLKKPYTFSLLNHFLFCFHPKATIPSNSVNFCLMRSSGIQEIYKIKRK